MCDIILIRMGHICKDTNDLTHQRSPASGGVNMTVTDSQVPDIVRSAPVKRSHLGAVLRCIAVTYAELPIIIMYLEPFYKGYFAINDHRSKGHI